MKLKFSFLLILSILSGVLLAKNSPKGLPVVDMEAAARDADHFNRMDYGDASFGDDSDDPICVSSDSESESEESSSAKEKEIPIKPIEKSRKLFRRNVFRKSDEEEARLKAEREARQVAIQEATKALYLEVRAQLKSENLSLHKLYLKWRSETKYRVPTLFELVKYHLKRFEFSEAKGLIEKLRETGMDYWEFNILRDAYTGLKKLHKYSVKFSDRSIDWPAARVAAYDNKFENFVLPLAKHHKKLRNVERAKALYVCIYGFISCTDVESSIAALYIDVYNHHANSRRIPGKSTLTILDAAAEHASAVQDDPGNTIVAASTQFDGIRTHQTE